MKKNCHLDKVQRLARRGYEMRACRRCGFVDEISDDHDHPTYSCSGLQDGAPNVGLVVHAAAQALAGSTERPY